jgi:hypothetical protein
MVAAGVMDSPAVSWTPVVYGRTAEADAWWQAMPEGADDSGWLVGVVRAAFAGGAELDLSPRFLLAQDRSHRIVGIACRARDLSARMCSDGQRELSCFVGWMTSRSAAATGGPIFADLQARYTQWAGPVYEEVMGAVWELPYSPFRRPMVTDPVAVPWGETVRYDLVDPVPRPAGGLWPPETWPHLWAAALATADPFTCVIGWQHVRSAQRGDVTYLGAADASSREVPLVPADAELVLTPLPLAELEPVAVPILDPPASSSSAVSPDPSRETPPWSWLPASYQLSSRQKKLAVVAVALAAVVVLVVVILTVWNLSSKLVPPHPAKPPASRDVAP